jgi:NitT/TauT family transport system permease protein
MKNSILKTKENLKNTDSQKYYYSILGSVILILIWKLISLGYNPIILPSPEKTFMTIYEMIFSSSFWVTIAYSFFRVVSAYLLSFITGSIIGIIMGLNKKIDIFLSPFISMLQTIPNISWILLAIIWFGLNSKIVIFTIFISILPIFVINSSEGIKNTSKEYLEMAAVYQLKPFTIFTKIYMYSIKPYLRSAAVITGERAWKIGAMAELLSLETGIGAGLYWARNNLQTERIFAWTIVLVVLGFASSQFLKFILSDK